MAERVILVLVRHGEAERLTTPDAARALTGDGKAEALVTGRLLAGLQLPAPRIYSSPFRRARETALCVAHAMRLPVTGELPHITPDDPVLLALADLEGVARAGSAVVAVMHMPLIAALVSELAGEDAPGARGVRTAGGVVLAGELVAGGLMRVERAFA